MDIRKIIVTGRMYKDLETLSTLDSTREYLFLPEEEVSSSHYDWADAYVAFKPTASFHFGKLQWVHALGAGVDAFLNNREWKQDVLLTRTIGSFGQKIAEYCLSYILSDVQDQDRFGQLQANREWQPSKPKLMSELKIVVFGTGTIGREVTRILGSLGVTVCGISRSGEPNAHFHSVLPIAEAASMLPHADWVINTLPLTEATELLFDSHLFSYMSGAGFINVGRGASVNEEALVEAITRGQVRKAVLDVFREEPLPAASPLWTASNVIITPHISAVTGVDEAVDGFLTVLNYLERGEEQLSQAVNISRGY
ncbi:phosphoglycerate dehydrogenase-like enzyme [Paenibacillus taihuensis]|uniref:Phosphoglycerate dehydrogenase-like enzyme n=1 Tax=Paenibacillus taihuensis TaxID=1156355 RepID=A0A3D9RSR4_9BACL|nr:D-2-hydroxyacid dehydrogenase [Paenibacillus taihuensis]REE80176.1 phosphoglycerate dehydrogenase-like enzyme [Paenibacillus taihuensis]